MAVFNLLSVNSKKYMLSQAHQCPHTLITIFPDMFIFKKPFINHMCNWSVKSYLIYKTRNINGILKPQRRGSASSYGSNYISLTLPT